MNRRQFEAPQKTGMKIRLSKRNVKKRQNNRLIGGRLVPLILDISTSLCRELISRRNYDSSLSVIFGTEIIKGTVLERNSLSYPLQ